MIAGSVSKRYAKALFELGREQNCVDELLTNLESFERVLRENRNLHAVLTLPSVSLELRARLLKELLAKTDYHDLTRRFLLLLAQKGRVDIMSDIVREYRNFYDAYKGQVRVTIKVAGPLDKEIESRLIETIQKRIGKKVIVNKVIDPSIIGGIVTMVGDLLFDGSISTRLARLKQSLLIEPNG